MVNRVYEANARSEPTPIPDEDHINIGFPQEGNPLLNDSTEIGGYWFFLIMEALTSIVELVDDPDHLKLNQVIESIRFLINRIPNNLHTWYSGQQFALQTLPFNSNIILDLDNTHFYIKQEDNLHFDKPINMNTGCSGLIRLDQNDITNFTISFDECFYFVEGTIPVEETTPESILFLLYYVISSDIIFIYAIDNVRKVNA